MTKRGGLAVLRGEQAVDKPRVAPEFNLKPFTPLNRAVY